MNRAIRVLVLFLPLLFASCQQVDITSDQPEELLNSNIVTEPIDTAPETDSDALLDRPPAERVGASFDPENPTPGFDLPDEPLTDEEIAFFKGFLAAIITESEQEEATDSLREVIRLNERGEQHKKDRLAEKEMISREEKRRQRLEILTAQYLKELQARRGSSSPRNAGTNTPSLSTIGATAIPVGGVVGTDKEVGETADRIEAARLAQQQLTQEDLLAQPIQPPQKQTTSDPVDGHQVTFKYDADGNITEKNADGVITQYLVESHIRPYAVILAEYDGAGNQIASYTYGLDHRPISQKRNGHRYRYTYANGNVVAITNENGEITDQYTYDAFGNVIDHIKTENSVINRFLAKGEYLDEDAGFYNLRARYYDPGTGRFISRDTWEGMGADPATLNKYLYANGNPVMGTDPSGQMSIMELLTVRNMLFVLAAISIVSSERSSCVGCFDSLKYIEKPISYEKIKENIKMADDMGTVAYWDPIHFRSALRWFYNMVRTNGAWDYKSMDRKYENFGNYHFGVVGSAYGIPPTIQRRGAGWYQEFASKNSDPEYGHFWDIGFDSSFGDDPNDQYWISEGIADYNAGCFERCDCCSFDNECAK